MHYVYLLRSLSHPDQTYVGYTSNLSERLATHNSKGSPHTSKFVPWEIMCTISFREKSKAEAFESYLKSGSGRAFAKKRLG